MILVRRLVGLWMAAELAKAAGLFSAFFLIMAFGIEYPPNESLSWRRRLLGAFVAAAIFAGLMTLLEA